MPYFGGATLASVLERLWDGAARPTLGSQLVEALEAVGSPAVPAEAGQAEGGERPGPPAHEPSPEAQTPLALWRGLGYYKAAAWIAAQLAEGLHHAHQRGILHRDIKPSNILLSAEGQPLLLDFNVAQEMTSDPTHAILGGTVAYAAPEHLAALLHRTSELIRRVDRRSDLYSLGLVLAEMVTGERLFERGGSYSAVTTQIETMAVERGRAPLLAPGPSGYPLGPGEHRPQMPGPRPLATLSAGRPSGRRPPPLPGRTPAEICPGIEPGGSGPEVLPPPSAAVDIGSRHRGGDGGPPGRRRGAGRRPIAPGRGRRAAGEGPGGGTEAGP